MTDEERLAKIREALPQRMSGYRNDIAWLLAQLEDRDHLIWVMSHDSDAYVRGQEDERRRWACELPGKLEEICQAHQVSRPETGVALMRLGLAVAALLKETSEVASPLPPEEARQHSARLRRAITEALRLHRPLSNHLAANMAEILQDAVGVER